MHEGMQAQLDDVGIDVFDRRQGGKLGNGLFGHAELQISLGGEKRPLAHGAESRFV